MRNYCRVYHTSMEYLLGMPVVDVMAELEDATIDLQEERKQEQKRMEKEKQRAKAKRPRPRHRRR